LQLYGAVESSLPSRCIYRCISMTLVELAATVLRDRFESDQAYRRDNTVPSLPSHKDQAHSAVLNRLHYYPHDTTVADHEKRAHQSGTCQILGSNHSHILREALRISIYQTTATCLSDMTFLRSYRLSGGVQSPVQQTFA
jgi:hypothetical protein